MPIQVNIKGLQKLQDANNRAIAALKPTGALGKALQWGVADIHRKSVAYTPHDTGALRASHRMIINNRQTMGRVEIDRTATNPRSGMRTAEYGYYLHQQGQIPGLRSGIRAFYEYVYERFGQQILGRVADIIRKALP